MPVARSHGASAVRRVGQAGAHGAKLAFRSKVREACCQLAAMALACDCAAIRGQCAQPAVRAAGGHGACGHSASGGGLPGVDAYYTCSIKRGSKKFPAKSKKSSDLYRV